MTFTSSSEEEGGEHDHQSVNAPTSPASSSPLDINDESLPLLKRTADTDSSTVTTPAAQTNRSLWLYLLLAGWALGSNFAFSAEFVLGTPLFQTLGLSYVVNSLVWLAGPISGLLVQPLVGAVSDSYTGRWGRRRVFIVAGLVVGTAGLALFGLASQIGAATGDTMTDHTNSIITAVISLWTLNIGLNIVQAAGWALTLDLCSTEQEAARGTSAVTTLTAIGNMAATGLGFAPLASVLTFFASDAQALLFIGIALFVLGTIPTLVAGREQRFVPPPKEPDATKPTMAQRWANFVKRVKAVPQWFWRLCAVYAFSSAATTTMLFSFTDYVGTSCFGGVSVTTDKHLRELYDEGVHWGSLCLAVQAGVMFVYSLMLPYLQKRISIRVLYCFGHVVGSVALAMPFFAFSHTKTMAMVITIPFAIFNATFSTLPFGMLSVASATSTNDKNNGGLYIGILNAWQVVAQMITNAIYGVIVQQTGNTGIGISLSAIFAIIGIPLCLILPKN